MVPPMLLFGPRLISHAQRREHTSCHGRPFSELCEVRRPCRVYIRPSEPHQRRHGCHGDRGAARFGAWSECERRSRRTRGDHEARVGAKEGIDLDARSRFGGSAEGRASWRTGHQGLTLGGPFTSTSRAPVHRERVRRHHLSLPPPPPAASAATSPPPPPPDSRLPPPQVPPAAPAVRVVAPLRPPRASSPRHERRADAQEGDADGRRAATATRHRPPRPPSPLRVDDRGHRARQPRRPTCLRQGRRQGVKDDMTTHEVRREGVREHARGKRERPRQSDHSQGAEARRSK